MNREDLKEYLDFKVEQYNTPLFIESDPIQLPHRFSKKEDIEIVAFLIATIAWGKRPMIIKNGERLIEIMENSPHEFIMEHSNGPLPDFVHRTFNKADLDFFFRGLKNIYTNGGLEKAFSAHSTIPGVKGRIVNFRNQFLETNHEIGSRKHISNPDKNSAAKRINILMRIIRQVNYQRELFLPYSVQLPHS